MSSPTVTVLRSLKRAAPAITRTPRPLKRSFESLGAIAAMTSCTCWWTLAKSTSAAPATTPKAGACATARACLAAAISDFEGTQPVLRHSPPILFFSTNTTGTPKAAAAAATERPPEPAPMTQMSGCRRSAMASPGDARGKTRIVDRHGSRIIRALARVRRRARAQPLHRHRNERQNAERHEGAEKLRRERRLHVEFEPAIGATRREAGLVGGLLGGNHAVEAGADEGKCEGDGDDTERGRCHERRERDPTQRRNEIDEPEWKNRHQP